MGNIINGKTNYLFLWDKWSNNLYDYLVLVASNKISWFGSLKQGHANMHLFSLFYYT